MLPVTRRLLIALIIAVTVFTLMAATMADVGLTWDEPVYMGSARSYASWLTVLGRDVLRLQPFHAFSPAVLAQYWNQPPADLHPPLGKIVPALTWRLLRNSVGDITAFRWGNAVIFSLLVALVYLVAAQGASTAAGIFAAGSLCLMPRMFFHGHLTALDVPVAFAWVLTAWLFWLAVKRRAPSPSKGEGGGEGGSQSRRSALLLLLAGLAYGLALGTKNTSFLIPIALGLWVLLFARTRWALTVLVSMVVIGALAFLGTWPWLFPDLAGRLREYLERVTISHWEIPQYYLGHLYARAPWHYPFVITLAAVPTATLGLSGLGALRALRLARRDAWGMLMVINALIPLLFFSFLATQAYGGERLFLVSFPFLAILAGYAFDWFHRRLTYSTPRARSAVRQLAVVVLALLCLWPGLRGILALHPHQLSYFSEIVGGLPGAERMGLELTYWCETYRDALPILNKLPEQSPSVWTEDDGVLYAYQHSGLLRSDLRVGGRVVQAGPAAADYALIQRRPSGFTPEIEALLQQREPIFVVQHDEIALAYLIENK